MSSEAILRFLIRAGAERVVVYVLRYLWRELQALTQESDTDLDNRVLDMIRVAIHDDEADPE